MKIYYSVFIALPFILLLNECSGPTEKPEPEKILVKTHEFTGMLVADTITYDVIIKNPNPDDKWTAKCLKQLHRKALIDSIFSMIYDGKAKAYDYDTGKLLSPEEIRKRENKTFKREDIGKIQFTEQWYLDEATESMQKKVLSMILGYEKYNNDGTLIGYLPVFKLILGKSPGRH